MARKILIAASLLGGRYKNLEELKEDVREVDAYVDWHHVDVMDGRLVETPSALDERHVNAVREVSKKFVDAHLMVQGPSDLIARYAKAGTNLITIHHEAFLDSKGALDEKRLLETIAAVKAAGCKIGLSVKPKTPASAVPGDVLKKLDLVLVMTVEPGKAGQAFMPEMLLKIREFAQRLKEINFKAVLQVDGGVKPENAKLCVDAGANCLVAASAIFNAKDRKAAVRALRGN